MCVEQKQIFMLIMRNSFVSSITWSLSYWTWLGTTLVVLILIKEPDITDLGLEFAFGNSLDTDLDF